MHPRLKERCRTIRADRIAALKSKLLDALRLLQERVTALPASVPTVERRQIELVIALSLRRIEEADPAQPEHWIAMPEFFHATQTYVERLGVLLGACGPDER